MSGAAAFARGDYHRVVMEGHPDDWRTHAAAGLIGLTEKALAGLAGARAPEARYYRAVALWIGGDDAAALAELRGLEGAAPARLAALIAKPVIRVLAMLPANRHGPHVHLTGAAADPRFAVANISTHADDLPLRPYAGIADYADPAGPPDLFVCEMVEWHQIPPDFTALPCPTIGVTSDFDLHIQGLTPWLDAFDALVVNDHTEHAGLAPAVRPPVHVFPLVFGWNGDTRQPERRPKDFDVFMSGTLYAPYHPDKAALLHRVLDIPDVRVLTVNGHLPEAAYLDLLGRSRMTVSYYRRPGGMVTRGIEAACMGCVTLLQEGSVLGLYAPPEHGLVPYDSTPEGLARAVAAVLAEPDALAERAWKAVDDFRAAFAPAAVASRFLRYCTWLASLQAPGTRPAPPHPLVQKRNMFWKGWMPGNGDPDFIEALRRGNVDRLDALAAREAAAWPGNDAARENLLDYATLLIHQPASEAFLLDDALDRFRRLAAAFPDALVPRFNFVRAALHFGPPDAVAEAAALLDDMLGRPAEAWRLDIRDDVFPYDFAGGHFDYRTYLDTLMAVLRGGDGAAPAALIRSLVDLVLASLHHHRALIRDDDGETDAEAAHRLNPGFGPFRLDLARRLIDRHSPEGRRQAARLLGDLVRRSAFADRALHYLAHLRAEGTPVPDFNRSAAHHARYRAATAETEGYPFRHAGPYFQAQRIGSGGRRGVIVHREPPERDPPPTVSLIILDHAADGLAGLLRGLAGGPEHGIETILVHLAEPVRRHMWPLADQVVSCGADGALMHVHRAWNAGLARATGRLVALVRAPLMEPADLPGALLTAFGGSAAGFVEPRAVYARGPDGAVAWLACRRLDALLCGGLDEHEAFHHDDLGEFLARLVHAGATPCPWGGTAGTGPEPKVLSARAAIWPHVFDGPPRRRPYREASGLFAQALPLIAGTPEGRAMLDGTGLDLLYFLRRGTNSRRTPEGLRVERDEPPGQILYGPELPLPAGDYRLAVEWSCDAGEAGEAAPAALVQVIADRERNLKLATLTPAAAGGPPVTIGFTVPRAAASDHRKRHPIDVNLFHLGTAGWCLRQLRLSRRA